MVYSKEKTNWAEKTSDIFLHWVVFATIFMMAPTIATMLMHSIFIRDFDISLYTSDILIIAASMSASAISETVKAKKKLTHNSTLLYRLLLFILFTCFFANLCVYLTFYGASTIPLGIVGITNLRKVGMGTIVLCFFIGLVMSFFEE